MKPSDRSDNFSFHRVRFMYTTNRTWRRVAVAALIALCLAIAIIIGVLLWYFVFRVPDARGEQRDQSSVPSSPEAPGGVSTGQYSGCFPPWAMVTSPAGPLRVDRLRVGERVLDLEGWTEVVAFTFTDEELHPLTQVTTEEGHVLTATPNHLLFVLAPQGPVDVPAGSVLPGQLLLTPNGTARVLRARSLLGRGARSPLTRSGSLLVDGLWVSAYTGPWLGGRGGHRLAHLAMAPLRALAALLDTLGSQQLATRLLVPHQHHLWYVRALKAIHAML